MLAADVGSGRKWYARKDLNLRPLAPEAKGYWQPHTKNPEKSAGAAPSARPGRLLQNRQYPHVSATRTRRMLAVPLLALWLKCSFATR